MYFFFFFFLLIHSEGNAHFNYIALYVREDFVRLKFRLQASVSSVLMFFLNLA